MIAKGQTCLVVQDGAQSQSTYCAGCAGEILSKADARLADLHVQIARAD